MPLRPRFRFRLATLLVVVAALGACLSVIANRAYRQREAVMHLERLGADIFFDFQLDAQGRFGRDALPPEQPDWARGGFFEDCFRKVVYVCLRDVRLTDEDLKAISALRDLESLAFFRTDFSAVHCEPLARLNRLKTLKLGKCIVGDCDLVPLGHVTSLEQLILSYTDIEDARMPDLSRLTELKFLNVESTSLTGSRLGDLQRLSKLKSVRVANTPFSDAGMKTISSLPGLGTLVLDATSVSDDGLAHLAKQPTLGRLLLKNTPITDRGVTYLRSLTSLVLLELNATQILGRDEALRQLREALPRCQIRLEGMRGFTR